MSESRVLDTFLELVQIDSPSKHEGAVAAYCDKTLRALGCDVLIDGSASRTGSDTGNLIATLPGTASGKVFITAHMDNVDPCIGVKPQVRDGIVYSDGTTVLGADDKVGLASAIETIRVLKDSGQPYPTVGVIFTVQEEVGLVGAQNIPEGLFNGELTLICDDEVAPGGMTIGSAYQYRFEFSFVGRASHSGVAPEKGISAIEMAAAAISGMEMGRIDETTTANIGSIEGGSATNVVAENCKVIGECRAMTIERLDEVRAQIDSAVTLAVEAFGGEVQRVWDRTVDGYLLTEDDTCVRIVSQAAHKIGLTPKTYVSCGATDGNYFAKRGACPIVLGTGMQDFHTKSEHIAVEDIENTVRLLVSICQSIAE